MYAFSDHLFQIAKKKNGFIRKLKSLQFRRKMLANVNYTDLSFLSTLLWLKCLSLPKIMLKFYFQLEKCWVIKTVRSNQYKSVTSWVALIMPLKTEFSSRVSLFAFLSPAIGKQSKNLVLTRTWHLHMEFPASRTTS